ncbi:MAG: hypothetical protein U1A78_00775 [Polyangia bacterium]
MSSTRSETSQKNLSSLFAELADPTRTGWESAWCGMEPTFTERKIIRLWQRLAVDEAGEDAYFAHDYTQGMCRSVAKAMEKKYKKAQQRGEPWCLFEHVERERDRDQWNVHRQNLHFGSSKSGPAFTLRIGLDPEVCEFSIKPVPLVWLYDPRFVQLLQELVWDVPQSLGLAVCIAHGGCQYSLSAKTYMLGSLLCDDIADKLNHPELACWTMDYPNCDDRSFRATRARRTAFQTVIQQYWSGAFHPRAMGTLRVENAYFNRGFAPASDPPEGLMSREHADAGPVGTLQEVMQTNFAFARGVRFFAQNVHPGYWQGAHPDEDGYRPDQIMRYGEGNLNRLQIVGELHVKSGKVLDPKRICELDAPLELHMLYDEASWESRAQYGRSSARDFIEAILLDVHRAQYLQRHPFVQPKPSLLQDQLLADAEETLVRHGGAARLDRLRQQARRYNSEESRGRIKSDFIEPETLFWEAWRVLPAGERAAIAREAVRGFTSRVIEAGSCDPRPALGQDAPADAMHWHRHRIHPLLWQALEAEGTSSHAERDVALRELRLFRQDEALYLSRRVPWSLLPEKDEPAPWSERPATSGEGRKPSEAATG